MAGAILGVENELTEAANAYGEMYAEAYRSAFDDLKKRVESDAAAVLGDDFQVLFYAISQREIEQRVSVRPRRRELCLSARPPAIAAHGPFLRIGVQGAQGDPLWFHDRKLRVRHS